MRISNILIMFELRVVLMVKLCCLCRDVVSEMMIFGNDVLILIIVMLMISGGMLKVW